MRISVNQTLAERLKFILTVSGEAGRTRRLSVTERFVVKLARSEAEKHAAFRLRYDVFVDEMKGDGPTVDHDARHETDQF